MADILRSEAEKMNASTEQVAEVIHKLVTRRQFLKGAGAAGLGVTTFYLMGCAAKSSGEAEGPRQVYVADAKGMIIAEPSRCVGCRRCELACPTGAIDPARGFASDPAECIMCLKCVDACHFRALDFSMRRPPGKPAKIKRATSPL